MELNIKALAKFKADPLKADLNCLHYNQETETFSVCDGYILLQIFEPGYDHLETGRYEIVKGEIVPKEENKEMIYLDVNAAYPTEYTTEGIQLLDLMPIDFLKSIKVLSEKKIICVEIHKSQITFKEENTEIKLVPFSGTGIEIPIGLNVNHLLYLHEYFGKHAAQVEFDIYQPNRPVRFRFQNVKGMILPIFLG